MKPAGCLFGVETEYALSILKPDGSQADSLRGASAIMRSIAHRHPHLLDPTSGYFLPTGGRLYLDTGEHLEYCTPECTEPWEAVRHVIQGERILQSVLAETMKSYPRGWDAVLTRCNVDYSKPSTAWGCHESYLSSLRVADLAAHVVPHLVTRVIYTGAGGFDSNCAGISFMLSPRMAHIRNVFSGDSTARRALFHLKDEPLTGKQYSRLHVITGESVCSQLAGVLKVGTTALVVAMACGGLNPAAGVELSSPLRAARIFSRDPSLRRKASMQNGRYATALEIQRVYLRQAEENLGKPFMPPWAKEVCVLWRKTLNELENGQAAARGSLDWPVKLALYRQRAARAGFKWEDLAAWSAVLRQLNRALERTAMRGQRVGVDVVLGPNSPIPETVARLTPFVRARGLDWRQLRPFLLLRMELCEADTLYGRLGPRGIFSQLDEAGILNHGVTGAEPAAHEVMQPPANTRAAVRGRLVTALSGADHRYHCNWTYVADTRSGRIVDLRDPFETAEKWVERGEEPEMDEEFQLVEFLRESGARRMDPARLRQAISERLSR